MKRNSYILLLSLFVIFSCNNGDTDYPEFNDSLDLEENIDQFIENFVSDGSPGISLLIRKDRKIVLRKNYGLANIEEGSLISADTPFYLASVSKQFTAMSTMILQERGKLEFSDLISNYLEEAPPLWSDITIHHLLTHRSGIPDYLNDLGWYRPGLTNQDVFQDLVKITDLEFEPGSKYDYSNSGYLLLTIITSKLSGVPFHEFMKLNVFDSLGMDETLVYEESQPEIPNRAIGYFNDGKHRDYDLLTTGDGGMFSTINDLDKWEQSFYDNLLISETTKKIAFTSYETDEYGYGWGIRKQGEYDHYGHGGGLAGYRTLISRIPDKGFSIIILSNGSYDWIYALRDEIIRLYL